MDILECHNCIQSIDDEHNGIDPMTTASFLIKFVK
jgi:hypothetical protein